MTTTKEEEIAWAWEAWESGSDDYCCEEHTPTLYNLSPALLAKQIELAYAEREDRLRMEVAWESDYDDSYCCEEHTPSLYSEPWDSMPRRK